MPTPANPYRSFVSEIARLQHEGKALPLGGLPRLAAPQLGASAPRALIFAPHPDDEVIIGGLPLRLLRQSGYRVCNVAVTQGSNRVRQAERWQELAACCEYVGFELIETRRGGL